MIKTIVSDDVNRLDMEVNEFMTSRKRNLPVRTEAYVLNFGDSAKVYHKATIFYDEPFADSELAQNTSTIREKVGALWIQKDNSISGTLDIDAKGERIGIPDNLAPSLAFLKEDTELEMTIKNHKVKVIRNKFKKEAKHPDYIIYR